MKKIITLLSFSFITSFCFSQGTWSQQNNCPGSQRYRAIAFEVNGKCYMGTGSTGGGITQNLNDLWEFDPILNSWSQKADLTAPARTNASASSVGNYGYVGLGSDKGTLLNDWWQFDPVGNDWQAVADFPGIKRYGAGTFSILGIIYVGGGLDTANQAQSDVYAYDPSNNTWTQKESLPIGVSSAATFTIGEKGYFVGGASTASINGTTQTVEYDPINNTWTSKAAYAAGNTFSAIGFSLFGFGYVGTGFTGNLTDLMWRFDPILDYWTTETPWPTGIRQWAVSCVTNNKAYVGTGNSTGGLLFPDWYEFIPAINSVNNLRDVESQIIATFDPVRKEIVVRNANGNETLKIFGLNGKLLFESSINNDKHSFSWTESGLFIMTLFDKGKTSATKIICLD